MTETELDENDMVRAEWYECVLAPFLCLVDTALIEKDEENKRIQARAAQVAEVRAYVDQC